MCKLCRTFGCNDVLLWLWSKNEDGDDGERTWSDVLDKYWTCGTTTDGRSVRGRAFVVKGGDPGDEMCSFGNANWPRPAAALAKGGSTCI